MFSTPETSLHVLNKNREVSPLEREEGYGGKERLMALEKEMSTPPIPSRSVAQFTFTYLKLYG